MVAVTADYTVGGASAVPSHLSHGKVTVMQYTLDCATTTRAAGTYSIFKVPQGCFIDCVLVDQVTPEGATATMTIGLWSGAPGEITAVQAAGFGTGLDLNAAAGTTYNSRQLTAVADTGVGAQVPLYYCGVLVKVDGFIGIVTGQEWDAAVVRITAVIFDVDAVA